MKWLVIFVHIQHGLHVEAIVDSEAECRRIGKEMYEIHQTAYMCADMGTGMLLDEAMKVLDGPLVTRDNIRTVTRELRRTSQ